MEQKSSARQYSKVSRIAIFRQDTFDPQSFVAAESKKSGANDALLLDYEDNVAETSIANVFFVKGETIFTPKTENIFPGITRDTILYLCHGEERDVSLQEAKEADAMFVTGTACEVLPVAR